MSGEEVTIGTPFAVNSEKKKNPLPKEASSLDDVQKVNAGFSNTITVVKEDSEVVYSGPDNTYISLGKDRPAEIGTGKQYDLAGAIYICAGASQGMPKTTEDIKDEYGQEKKANRSGNLDASWIYLTAKGDIDRYYGITPGKMGRAPDEAAIAIKSTNVRVIARSGIKLVTGTDLTNEKLSKIGSFVGIELIAGNDSSDLQPIVKGKNLAEALQHLSLRIKKVIATIEAFAQMQNDFNMALSSHNHPDILNMLISLFGSDTIFALTDGRSLADPMIQARGELVTGFINEVVLKNCVDHRENMVKFEKKYLSGTEKKDINSRYHKVN